jgi:hypothetical protein
MDLSEYLATAKGASRSKYGNVRTQYQGRWYDSKAEANFAMILDADRKQRSPAKKVVDVQPQVPYQVTVNGKKICKYIADFVVTYGDGRVVVYDVKGVRTGVYKLKKKLVEALYPITIVEV